MKYTLSLLLFVVINSATFGQTGKTDNTNYPSPVKFSAQEAQENMMQQLGIISLRPGASMKKDSPYLANYEEELANPCPELPSILVSDSGVNISTPKQWRDIRRPELLEILEDEVYGKIPADLPSIIWEAKRTENFSVGQTPVIAKHIIGQVDNSAYLLVDVNIDVILVLPTDQKHTVPVLVMLGGMAFPDTLKNDPSSPTQQLLAAGWGYAILNPSSVQADNYEGMTTGIIGLVNKGQPRTPEQWGSLRARAWGASKVLDYLETVKLVDSNKVGIEGVSRFGKAALVAMAFDERFATGLIGSSGKGGVTLHRRVFGEAVENLTGRFGYWMAGNYLKYGADKSAYRKLTGCDLPVDSHDMLALCAPRPVFVSYGIPESGDSKWLDQKGSYMAVIAAGKVYKLLGAKDLGVSNDYIKEDMPPYNTAMLDGDLAWRQHEGGHTDAPNFHYFIPWANLKLGMKR